MLRRAGIIALIVFGLAAIVSACWGQTAAEPWRDDPQELGSVVEAAAEPLQALIDDPSPISDLGGQTWTALDIVLQTKHSGEIISNGRIVLQANANIGCVKFIQGKWNYPSGVIDATFRNVVFDGGFDRNDGLQERNESLADGQGRGANAVTTITNKAGIVRFANCCFINCGNSAIAGSFDKLEIINCRFSRVAKHAVGARQFGGSFVKIDGMICIECGNALDLHGDQTIFPTADIARIDNVTVIDSTGRSKISGANWDADITNWNATQSNVVNLNLWAALDLARNPRRLVVRGFTAVNFPTMGIGSLADANPAGVVELRDLMIRNSLSGVKVQQRMSVVDSEFDQVHHRFRSGAPFSQSNNVDLSTEGDLYWAQTFDAIHLLYAKKNKEWATNYVPAFWLPLSVRNLMTTK